MEALTILDLASPIRGVGWGHLRGGGFASVGAAQLGESFGSVDAFMRYLPHESVDAPRLGREYEGDDAFNK